MKKLLFLLPLLVLVAACGREAEEPLSSIDSDDPEVSYYNAVLTKTNSGLTTDDSTEEIITEVASNEDTGIVYSFKIGAPCYQHSTYNEFVMKNGAYIKSNSSYTVDRLIIDFWGTKGVNFNVYANADGTGDVLEYHESTIEAEDPDDGGMVYEYAINGTEWCINNTSTYKPGFYSITVVFAVSE